MAKIVLSCNLLSIFVIGNVHSTCSDCCPEVLKPLNEIKDSLPNSGSAICRLIRTTAIDINNPKKILNIEKNYRVIASGNDFFLTTLYNKNVYLYNQVGTQKFVKQISHGDAAYMDVYDGILYVTDRSNTVYTMPVSGNEAFTEHNVGMNTFSVKVSDDGERIAVSTSSPGKINIYDKNF